MAPLGLISHMVGHQWHHVITLGSQRGVLVHHTHLSLVEIPVSLASHWSLGAAGGKLWRCVESGLNQCEEPAKYDSNKNRDWMKCETGDNDEEQTNATNH